MLRQKSLKYVGNLIIYFELAEKRCVAAIRSAITQKHVLFLHLSALLPRE